jgi:hypothetical protein
MTTRAKTHATELIEAAKNVVPNPAIEVTEAMKLEMQHQIEMQSMLAGINDAFFVSVFIAGLALVLALFIKRAKQAEDPGEIKPSSQKVKTKLVEN